MFIRLGSILLLVLTLPALHAQYRLNEGAPGERRMQSIIAELLERKEKDSLSCSIRQTPAQLSFDLNIWSGFFVEVPARQYDVTQPHGMVVGFRVTPLEPAGEPAYFYRRWDLKRLPIEPEQVRKAALQFSGGFLLGPGKYRVEWALIDEAERFCRSRWELRYRSKKDVHLAMSPGELRDGGELSDWNGFRSAPESGTRRVTVIIDANAVFRRRFVSGLSWGDRRVLLRTLTLLLERGGFTSARVVAIDLNRRRTLFETDAFDKATYRQLSDSLQSVDMATIDYQTLSHGPSVWSFLDEVLGKESRHGAAPDDLIFITPAWHPEMNGRPVRSGPREGLPSPVAIAFVSQPWPEGAVVDVVRSMKGRIFPVMRPADLLAAILRIEREASQKAVVESSQPSSTR